MRKKITTILLIVCTVTIAQEKRIYFFSDFVKTNVLYKNGAKSQAMINYDVANRKVMYLQGGQLMEMIHLESIDTLYMGGSKWIYKDKKICEIINTKAGNRVLLDWHITKVHVGYKGAYGTSQAPSRKLQLPDQFGTGNIAGNTGGMYNGSFGVNQYDGNGRNLDVWKNKNQSTYYFTKNGKEYAVKDMRSIYKTFPEQKERIQQYCNDYKLDMTDAEKALKIIDYLLAM